MRTTILTCATVLAIGYAPLPAWSQVAIDGGVPDHRALTVEAIELLPHDPARARQMLEEAAMAGNPRAARVLGQIYLRGDGVDPDAERAARLFETAAEVGDLAAMLNLGRLYRDGRGVEQDDHRAMELFALVADQDDVRGIRELGRLLVTSDGVGGDTERAATLLREAYARGDTQSALPLGLALAQQGETEEAALLLREAYQSGLTAAALPLARLVDDEAEREQLYEAAAEWGNSAAMAELGRAILADTGRSAADYVRAVSYVRRAHEAQVLNGLSDAVAPDARTVVAAVQSMLADLGFQPGPVDGIYGPWTRQALRNFAETHDIAFDATESERMPGQTLTFELSRHYDRGAE